MKTRKYIIILVSIIISGTLLLSFNSDQKNFQISKNLDIYYTLFRELNTFYVDENKSQQTCKIKYRQNAKFPGSLHKLYFGRSN